MAGIVETAIQHHRDGQLADALMLYELILDEQSDPQLVHLAGLACQGLAKHAEAEMYLMRAAAAAPQRLDFILPCGNVLIANGRFDRFQGYLKETGNPDLARLGLLKTINTPEAGPMRDTVVELARLYPGDGQLAGVHGYAHLLNRDPWTALSPYRAGRRLLPDQDDIRRITGLVAAAVGDVDEVKSCFAADRGRPCEVELRAAIEFMLAVLPDACKLPMIEHLFQAADNLRVRHFCLFHVIGLKAMDKAAEMLCELAATAEVTFDPPPDVTTPVDLQDYRTDTYFSKAVTQDDGDYVSYLLLAVAHAKDKDLHCAMRLARKAVDLKPDDAEALLVLARYTSTYDLKRAVQDLRDGAPCVGFAPEVLNLLGNLRMRIGDMAGAAEAYDQARARLGPLDGEKLEWQLLTSNYRNDLNATTIAGMHRAWGEALENRLAPRRRPQRLARTSLPIRVGYVSGDFKTTSPSYFLRPLLEQHDPERVTFYLYATHEKDDEGTAWFRNRAGERWRTVSELDDDALADLIQQDEIDILVDLCGHTYGARLPVFALKPAPVQVTWLGYPNTTGLRAIEYRFTDALADPPGMTEPLHTEALWRLPNFLCYRPMDQTPAVALSPCLTRGYATFGCFNNSNKLTPEVVAAWAEILRRSPGTRLILKTAELGDSVTVHSFVKGFTQHGIDRTRIEFLPALPNKFDHLAVYSRIDLALDPFPYNGTTTTFEAMWMGVPTLTLAGRVHAARVGVSLMTGVGLPGLVADNLPDYIGKAVAFAQDLPRLAGLRKDLRQRLAASPLMDGKAFAASIEEAYSGMLQAVHS